MSPRRVSDTSSPIPNKRRRTDDDGHHLTSKRRLYTFLNGGRSADVDILVIDKDKVKRMPAHKNILVAMSSVISAELNRDLEDIGQGRDVVEIPSNVGVVAVEMFLKFLYTEELNEDLSIGLWLELIFLAYHYKVENLIRFCDMELTCKLKLELYLPLRDKRLTGKLNLEDIIKIYERCRLIQGVKCGETAFKIIKMNLGEILTQIPEGRVQIGARTWETILSLNYMKNVEEIELFEVLKWWKEENVVERASDFQKLVKLIRFPLIGLENFVKFVVPCQILDVELKSQILMYFEGKGPIPEQFKDCQPRSLLEPKDSGELAKFILESQNGDVIELNGTYSPFVIPESKINLTIRKKNGGEAIIKPIKMGRSVIIINQFGKAEGGLDKFGITIYGQQCKIDGISIIFDPKLNYEFHGVYVKENASQTVLQNITITGGSSGLKIHGNENSISNIEINNTSKAGVEILKNSQRNEVPSQNVLQNITISGGHTGLKIHGQQNLISNLKINNISETGVEIGKNSECNEVSNQNVFQNISIEGCYIGLKIIGNGNSISNIAVINPKQAGVAIWEGSKNNEISSCSVLVTDEEVLKDIHGYRNKYGYGFIVEGEGGNKLSNLITKNIANLVESRGNVIKGFEISGKNTNFGLTMKCRDNHLEKVRITGDDSTLCLAFSSKNITVINCQSDKIVIRGNSHKVEDSKAKEMQVLGREHKFKNCEAEKLEIEAEIQSTGCDFKIIKPATSLSADSEVQIIYHKNN